MASWGFRVGAIEHCIDQHVMNSGAEAAVFGEAAESALGFWLSTGGGAGIDRADRGLVSEYAGCATETLTAAGTAG